MKQKLIIGFFVFAVTALGSVFLYTKLFAQSTPTGLSITPFSFDLAVNPGQSITRTITLSNLTDKTVTLNVNARNFTASGEEGEVSLTTEESNFSLSQWTGISPTKVTLQPRQKQDFTVIVSVPKSAEPGGHFGSVVFATVPNTTLHQTGAVLSQEIAALLLVRVPGHADEEASIASFTTPFSFYEFGPIPFTIRVRNSGNVHVKPTGSVVVTNMLGQSVAVPVTSLNVLPGAIRRLSANLPNKFLIGKYTATVTLAYGTQNNALLTQTIVFYVFPVRLGLVVLFILILLFLIRKRLLKAAKTLITGK